ncbi:MAG: hypothetical protein U5L45_26390 [Saprospiraceae bacterium]|nr:hypothetical protein [Saprospiraceae bacterium]
MLAKKGEGVHFRALPENEPHSPFLGAKRAILNHYKKKRYAEVFNNRSNRKILILKNL